MSQGIINKLVTVLETTLSKLSRYDEGSFIGSILSFTVCEQDNSDELTEIICPTFSLVTDFPWILKTLNIVLKYQFFQYYLKLTQIFQYYAKNRAHIAKLSKNKAKFTILRENKANFF